MKGKVYLIGMGPGDPELITLRAVNAMEVCDVLVYDRLVNPIFLEYNKIAKKIYVGKSTGEHTKTQDEINEIIANLAKDGLVVGRLKGGDPFVFGRGGEEALYLGERGIDYEVIPGITSSIAVPAYAGIPVTQRKIATSFHVITGHEHGEDSDIEWESLAKIKGTLIFLMGVESLDIITKNLIEMGKDKSCPAAVIMNGTRYNQTEVFGTLEDIGQKSKGAGIKSPAIIIIGEVVELHNKIGRRNSLPLGGLTVVITRPYDKSNGLTSKLRSLGAGVQTLPCIQILPVEVNLSGEEIKSADAFFFSSSYGVKYFIEAMKNMKLDIRTISGRIYGVGVSIKKELESYGIFDCITPAVQNSEEAIRLVHETLPKGSRIVVVSGTLGIGKVCESLSNFNTKEVIVYDTVEGCNEEAYSKANAIVFTSPSCVRGFLSKNSVELFKEKLIICIGKSTYDEATRLGFQNVEVPKQTSEDSIVEFLLDWSVKNA